MELTLLGYMSVPLCYSVHEIIFDSLTVSDHEWWVCWRGEWCVLLKIAVLYDYEISECVCLHYVWRDDD